MPLYAVYHTDYITDSDCDDPFPPDVYQAENGEAVIQRMAKNEKISPHAARDESALINLDLLFDQPPNPFPTIRKLAEWPLWACCR
jgi:hypothetical protein